jgi:hypothetical protein
VNYDETIMALMSFIGRPVLVEIAFRPPPQVIGTMRGVLYRADVDPGYQEKFDPAGEALFFKVGGGPTVRRGAAFAVSRGQHYKAQWAVDDKSCLRIAVGQSSGQIRRQDWRRCRHE